MNEKLNSSSIVEANDTDFGDVHDIPGYDDYIEHWGIKGQHWGERRFQNEDGSLTPAGRDRYGIGPAEKGSSNENAATKVISKIKANKAAKAEAKRKAEIAAKRAATIAAKKEKEEAAKKAEEDRKKKIRTMSAEYLAEHMDEYNDDEIAEAMKSIRTRNELNNLSVTEARTNNDLKDQQLRSAKSGAETLGVVTKYGQQAISLYNVAATLCGKPTLEKRAELALKEMANEMGLDKNTSKAVADVANKKLKQYAKELSNLEYDSNGELKDNSDQNKKAKKLAEKLEKKYADDPDTLNAIVSEANKMKSAKKGTESLLKADEDRKRKYEESNNKYAKLTKQDIMSEALQTPGFASATPEEARKILYNIGISKMSAGNPSDRDEIVEAIKEAQKDLSSMSSGGKQENKGNKRNKGTKGGNN